jgi:hypothetical protein
VTKDTWQPGEENVFFGSAVLMSLTVNTFIAGGITENITENTHSKGVILVDNACLRFFSLGNTGQVGIRNNCAECKVAVVSILGGVVGQSGSIILPGTLQRPAPAEVKKFRVNKYDQVTIPIARQSQEIIGEEPCQ